MITKIREVHLPEIDHYAVLDVTTHDQYGISLFQHDNFRGETRSAYISLTDDESRKLYEVLKEKYD